jgi:Mg2+ and Co2+ transporter CorA
MNFDHVPALPCRFGYPIVIGAILVVLLRVYRSSRRNGWL